jgi:hypothetical protein
MAPTISSIQPTRSSKRLRDRKEAADKAAPAAATTAAEINGSTKNNRKGRSNPKRKTATTNRKTISTKILKRTTPKKSKNHRYILSPIQLSTILDQHRADGADQMWVGGDFYVAGPGEEVPVGSVELTIKVPAGLKFLKFPHILNLGEGSEMREGCGGQVFGLGALRVRLYLGCKSLGVVMGVKGPR